MSCCCSMQTEAAGARQGGDGASSLASMSGRQGGQRKGRKATQRTGRPGGARRRGATRGHGREATGLARRRWGRGPAGGVRLGTGKGGGGRPDLVVEPAAGGGGARDREGEMGIEQMLSRDVRVEGEMGLGSAQLCSSPLFGLVLPVQGLSEAT